MSEDTTKKVLLNVEIQNAQAVKAIADLKTQVDGLRAQQKALDISTIEGRQAFESLGQQIKALNTESRNYEKQIQSEVKAQNANKESMFALEASISLLTAEYKNLSKEEQKSAAGKELQAKIYGIRQELTKANEGMGNFRDSVGMYENKIKSALGLSDGFAGKLTDVAKGGKVAGKAMLEEGVSGVKAFGTSLLTLLANPIVAIIAGIAAVIMLVVGAMQQNGEVTKKVNQLMAPFKMVLELVTNTFAKLVGYIVDGVVALNDFALMVAKHIPLLDKLAEKAEESINLKKQEQELAGKIRQQNINNSADELKIAELKEKSRQKDKYSAEERLKFNQDAIKLEKDMAVKNTANAVEQLRIFDAKLEESGKTKSMMVKAEKDERAGLEVAINNAKAAGFQTTLKLTQQEQKLRAEIIADEKAKADAIAKINDRVNAANVALLEIKKNRAVLTNETLIKDEKAAITVRIDALNKQKDDELKLIDARAKEELKKEGLLKSEKNVINEKAKNDKLKVENDTTKAINEITKKEQEKQLTILLDAAKRSSEIDKLRNEEQLAGKKLTNEEIYFNELCELRVENNLLNY